MEMERQFLQNFQDRLAIFVDYHNLEASLRNEGHQVDILSLRDYLSEGRWLLETFVYIGFNPNNHNGSQNFHQFLRMNGFMVRTKPAKVRPDGSLKCDFDIELALDIVDYVEKVKPDIVVLVSGDGDFTPLATWLRLRGLRIEVAAVSSTLSQTLREEANGYIDLFEAIQEIQRRGEEISLQREEVITNGTGNHQRQEGADPGHSI